MFASSHFSLREAAVNFPLDIFGRQVWPPDEQYVTNVTYERSASRYLGPVGVGICHVFLYPIFFNEFPLRILCDFFYKEFPVFLDWRPHCQYNNSTIDSVTNWECKSRHSYVYQQSRWRCHRRISNIWHNAVCKTTDSYMVCWSSM